MLVFVLIVWLKVFLERHISDIKFRNLTCGSSIFTLKNFKLILDERVYRCYFLKVCVMNQTC